MDRKVLRLGLGAGALEFRVEGYLPERERTGEREDHTICCVGGNPGMRLNDTTLDLLGGS